MSNFEISAMVGAVAFVLFGAGVIVRQRGGAKGGWLLPAGLSALFLGFSAIAVAREGPLGFWAHHIDGFWGNQIWFDLLLAAGMMFFLVAPRARAAGMALTPWFILVICTGSIGMLALVARVLYLEERA